MTTEIVRPNNRNLQAPRENAAVDALISRAAQEVQAMVAMAKRFPRDEADSIARIIKSCQRPNLAEVAEYQYPRGDTQVTGPSIRLAEVLAQQWGNFEHGTVEIEQQGNSTLMLSYAWDYERNTRSTKQFRARHIREKKSGNVLLTEPRDIYEAIANFAARRTRACILALIPKEVQDLATMECQQTLIENDKRPPKEQIEEMIAKFSQVGVNVEMIRMRLRHRVVDCTPREIIGLRKVYNSIADQIGSVSDYFVVDDPKRPATSKPTQTKSERVAAEVGAGKAVADEQPGPEASGGPGEHTGPRGAGEPGEVAGEPQKEPWELPRPPRETKAKGKPTGMLERIKQAGREELDKIANSIEQDMPECPERVKLFVAIQSRWKEIFEELEKTRQPGDEE